MAPQSRQPASGDQSPQTLRKSPAGAVLSFLVSVGRFYFSFCRLSYQPARLFYKKCLYPHLFRVRLLFLGVQRVCSKAGQRIFRRFFCFLKFFADVGRAAREGYRSAGESALPVRLFAALAGFSRRLWAGGFRPGRLVNYLMPCAAAAAFLFLINGILQLNLAVQVEYNGEPVGYVADETVYAEAETRLQSRLIHLEEDQALYTTPGFQLAVVDKSQLQSGLELTNALIRSSAVDIVQATGVRVDGEFLGAVKNAALLQDTLDQILARYRGGENQRVEFTKSVELEQGLYLQSNLIEEQMLINTLTADVEQNIYYTAVSGDTPSGIAAMYDMRTEDLVELNPAILTDLKIGQQVLVNRAEPFLPVREIRQETYTESIAYETIYLDNSSLYEGMTSVISAGREGTRTVTAEVSYVGGVETERKVLTQSVTVEPVAAKIYRGTMKMQVASGYENARKSEQGFVWPVSGGYISQYYGHTPYEYWHNGIDYATSYGRSIVSVLPGTVTFAGRRGSYGNLVIVNHGNGIETWYAHCASVTVRAGDTVAQGQQIAKVGSTGNSSGNHLHFRVIVGGSEKNPMNYLP